MMQFTKSELKIFKNPKQDNYEVTVVHMHGDADYYTTDVHDFSFEQEMLDFVNFLHRCIALYPRGMGGDDGYWEVEGYHKYEDYLHQDNEYCGGHATPQTITTVYYDIHSVKWGVKLT